MSVQAISAVLDHSRVTKGARLTAISLANHADRYGITWPSLRLAGEEALLKRRAVQEAIKVLREKGELVLLVEADGQTHRPPLYWIRLPGLTGAFDLEGGGDRYFKAFGDDLRREAEAVMASLDPGADSAPGAENTPGGVQNTTRALYRGTVNKPSTRAREGRAVNRKPVTDAEYALASEIVSSFNAIAGTSYTADAHLTPIVGRIREHPKLEARHHSAVILHAFKDPWWRGHPSPRVIYGNAGQFESSVEAARLAQKKSKGTVNPNAERKRVRREQGLG